MHAILLTVGADGDVIAMLREQCEARLRQGAELVSVELEPPHLWLEFAGMFQDDPLID